jgi:hypothetical protein
MLDDAIVKELVPKDYARVNYFDYAYVVLRCKVR